MTSMNARTAKKLRDRVIDLQRELNRYRRDGDEDVDATVIALASARRHLESIWVRAE